MAKKSTKKNMEIIGKGDYHTAYIKRATKSVSKLSDIEKKTIAIEAEKMRQLEDTMIHTHKDLMSKYSTIQKSDAEKLKRLRKLEIKYLQKKFPKSNFKSFASFEKKSREKMNLTKSEFKELVKNDLYELYQIHYGKIELRI